MNQRFLQGRSIGISISESPDLDVLGLSRRHLQDVMVEVARHLLAAGANLLYGGDLRTHGFTRLLFELVARHRKGATDSKPPVTNYLAWPVYMSLSPEDLSAQRDQLGEAANIIPLTLDGSELPHNLPPVQTRSVSAREWEDGLTAMREVVTSAATAQVLLGGQTDEYRGRMPGIAEEALLALSKKKSVFLIGGFGGCAADIAQELDLGGFPTVGRSTSWHNRKAFAKLGSASLNNGLATQEVFQLAHTVHTDEIVGLILRGLHRVLSPKT